MGNEFIEIASLLLSIIALILVVFAVFVNIYFSIRKCFSATVNCWFCNTWSKVLYENRNSFDCPNCLQYNGFTKDGSYNKIIEAQHNVSSKTLLRPAIKSSNGFCDSCNHNQQLKITQLANFTPLKEKNYDEEIEHFKKQLEKAYQLCKPCSRILKYTLLKEKASFFGRHAYNIQKKGLNIYLNKSKLVILTNTISVRSIRKIQGCVALVLIFNRFSQILFSCDVSNFLPNLMLPYFELLQDLYLLIPHIASDLFKYFTSSFLVNTELCKFEYFTSIGLTLELTLFLMETSLMSIKVNQIMCWSFLTLTSVATNPEIFIYTHLFQIFCAALIFYHSFFELDAQITNPRTFQKLKGITGNLDEYSDEELDVSSQSTNSCQSFMNCTGSSKSLFNSSLNKTVNKSPNYKTEKIKYTANDALDTSINTAKNLTNASLYSNIQNSLEDLHLGNSTFKIDKSNPLPFSRLSPVSDRSKLVLSPSKLKTVTQNSWVAGGFWRNEDGSIVPISENVPLSRSSSQSSGFGSQINENPINPFNSLPTSTKNSLCGDLDRFSLASEPAYHFQPLNPQPSWTSLADLRAVSPSNPFSSNTYRNIYKASNLSSDKFAVPNGTQIKSQIPFYSTSKPLGLFKLPQISTINSGTHSHDIGNREFTIHPSNIDRFSMNNESF